MRACGIYTCTNPWRFLRDFLDFARKPCTIPIKIPIRERRENIINPIKREKRDIFGIYII